MSAAEGLDRIEARLTHEPCCEHVATEYGNCFDCRNTGCAHAAYIDNEHALTDMTALAAALRAVLAEHVEVVWTGTGAVCDACAVAYPCLTVRAITAALTGDPT